MSVYQVEQYYVHIKLDNLTDGKKIKIEDLLHDKGWTNYEFNKDDILIVDDIESESDGVNLEEDIKKIMKE